MSIPFDFILLHNDGRLATFVQKSAVRNYHLRLTNSLFTYFWSYTMAVTDYKIVLNYMRLNITH